MRYELQLQVKPEKANDLAILKKSAAFALHLAADKITSLKILRRSIDARKSNIKINLTLEILVDEIPVEQTPEGIKLALAKGARKVIIIGAGPAGLFAAMTLLEKGIRPVILERGKNVRARRRDLAALNKLQIVDPDSNYCFGEGGAGTYSDGKLYTRSGKRGDTKLVLETFVAHGANADILVDAHPHIGTNKLPGIITAIRESIIKQGGEFHFRTRAEDFIIQENEIKEVIAEDLENNEKKIFAGEAVILATGHSARNIYEMLHAKNILLEAKSFAMGVRIEHPQELIDAIQYHCLDKADVERKRKFLPASSYSMVQQVDGRGVYSFCMCPGGIIAPCATSPGEIVTNGWSPSKRNNPFANSGIVAEIQISDLDAYKKHGVLAGLRYQQSLERMAFEAGKGLQVAPAQRMIDFIQNKNSSSLPPASYQPGMNAAPLHELLPSSIGKRLQEALKIFGKKMRGYASNEAVLVGVESRTSTPVRIPRNENGQHPQIKNLYPCGEGAGFAGGIVSAAMDGMKVGKSICLIN